MNTKVLEINLNNIEPAKIKKAARVIREGGLVAFPTETVYGLGGDALNPHAVVKIFEAKNRPLEGPLIVHISQRDDLFKLAKDVPDMAMELTDKFWPGPLTLVLRRSDMVPDIVSAGSDTVAVRIPDNELALTLIKESQTPIAAPSANLFGRPSPTCARHVLDDLDGRIDIVIDGGMTFIGLESTVLDLAQEPPYILRPGGVSKEKLKKIIPTVEIYKQNKILSPGMYPRHYAPDGRARL
ncbi:MAG: L-threonylcarbamoyladenylate synthase [bacterium]